MRSARQILDHVAKLKKGVVCEVTRDTHSLDITQEDPPLPYGSIVVLNGEVSSDNRVPCRPVFQPEHDVVRIRWKRLKPLPPLVALAYQADSSNS